jgi:hypothetical protein
MRWVILAAVGVTLAWIVWPQDTPDVRTRVENQRAGASNANKEPAANAMPFFGAVPSATPVRSAAASMAATRLHGDPEAPPIARDPMERELPSPVELADPNAYQAYEARQTQRVYAAYVRAVDDELPRLMSDIVRGRAMGIAPEEIAKAEEKARQLKKMRASLAKELEAAH